MKIGYPCINLSIGCSSNKTFRIKSYSEERLVKTVKNNLDCLFEILKYNLTHKILFFRITSDLIPFASHPICQFNWQEYFKEKFIQLGRFIRVNDIRISMHPDQFTLINSPDQEVLENSLRELLYHAEILDLMKLPPTAKIQLHVGGVYGDKKESIKRFIKRYKSLHDLIKKRLVIENDDRNYNLSDCLRISHVTGVPVLFDVFHHRIYNSRENLIDAFQLFTNTWSEIDGIPMVDYSSQEVGNRIGKHSKKIDPIGFRKFLDETAGFNYDIMLEIKDKEKSALIAIDIASSAERLAKDQV